MTFYRTVVRFFDIIFSLIGIFLFLPLFILIFLIGLKDTGSPLFFQKRVGINLKHFILIKFRTMNVGTLSLGTHLVDTSNISHFGYYLRKSKLDELPQLLNVLIGDMSLVGPRPCLLNQRKLINERKKRKIFRVKPGITGLAQIKGITMQTPTLLAKTELQMVKHMNLYKYFHYIFMTFLIVIRRK